MMKHPVHAAIAGLILFTNVMAEQDPVVLAPAGNACLNGYVKLTTLPGCIAAMNQLSIPEGDFQGPENESNWPGGCYHCNGVDGCTNGVWFNYAKTGAANGGATPICAVPGWEDDTLSTVETLFVGDSDIARWETASVFPNSFNVGVGGFTCDDVIGTIDEYLASFDPNWVVIVCGENDLFSQGAEATFVDFKEVIQKIVSSGARALYLGTKPEPSTQYMHSKYRNYDAKIREHADILAADDSSLTSSPPLVMVDVYPSFVELGNPKTLYDNDRLHLSDHGYASYWDIWTTTALADTTDCVRWKNNACDAAGTTTTTTSTTTKPNVSCENDDTWTFTNRKNKVKNCNWVGMKPWRRCNKIGDDGTTVASEACRGACNEACL